MSYVSFLQGGQRNHAVKCVLVLESVTRWPPSAVCRDLNITVRNSVMVLESWILPYHNYSLQEGRDVMSHKEFLDCASSADMKCLLSHRHNCQAKPSFGKQIQTKHPHQNKVKHI